MKCIECKSINTRVVSTDHKSDAITRRYIKCLDCDARFITQETYAERLKPGSKPGTPVTCKPLSPAKGERVHTSVLTETNVKHLRDLAANGYSRLVLAKRFGINLSTVDRIIKRKTWKHI